MFEARNIKITKTERDIDGLPDHKAIDYGFESDIYKDGEFHHSYNEPRIGLLPNMTQEENVTNIINNHLKFWEASSKEPSEQRLETIKIEPVPEKTQEELDLEDFLKILNQFRTLEMNIKNAETSGFVVSDEIKQQLDTKREEVQNKLKPEYIKFF